MKTTFTEIHWRSSEDSEKFNLHAVKSITLDGMKNGIMTIEGVAGDYKAPYCNLHFGGGIDHFEVIIPHPYDCEYFLELAIFDGKVCVTKAVQSLIENWFKAKCKNFCI